VDLAADYRSPTENVTAWAAKLTGEGRSAKTMEMYRYYAERFLERSPRPTRLDVQGYLAERLKGGTPPSTAENERKALTSLFKFLVEEGLWHEDPTSGLRHIRVPYSEKQPPSVEDVERVLAVGFARARDAEKMRMITVLLATTGLRLTECLTALKENVDIDGRSLKVLGKGNKWRTVPLLESTLDALVWWMEERAGSSLFLFPGDTREGHAHISNVEKTLKRACVRAGVKPFTPHQLRHFVATESLKDGAKLDVVSRILGHADAGITSRIYRHVGEEEMREEVERHAPLNGGKGGEG
jgi:integrase/recombinase XerC